MSGKNKSSAQPAVIVIFGAAGDLTKRKLIPALFNLAAQELLPPQIAMVGTDRVAMDSEAYRQSLSDEVQSYVGEGFNQELWNENVNKAYYTPGDFRDAQSYQQFIGKSLRILPFLFSDLPITFGTQNWVLHQIDKVLSTYLV